MQKIILKKLPCYDLNNIVSTFFYFGALSIVTYACYLYTSPLFVLQALLSWVIIYNTTLWLFGSPPTIDNIYFLGNDDESHFYPYLDGSHQNFPLFTELFVCYVSSYIIARDRIYEFPNVTNLFSLLVSIYFWRKLIFLLRGINRYGKQSLDNSIPRHYVQHGRHGKPRFYILFNIVLYSSYSFVLWKQNLPGLKYMFLPYILFVSTSGLRPLETGAEIISIIIITILTILQFHFADVSYSLIIFFLLLVILFIYLISLWAKDILLRESHIYLSDELTCDALKHDVKAYVQSLGQKTKYALYLASGLYVIFVVLMFSVIFRLDFACQLSRVFGLDYFFKVVSIS